MATNDLTKGVEIVLGDKTVYVRPLTIRQLRKFVVAIKDLKTDTVDLTDDDITKMREAASIALSKADPELAADPEALEDVLDIRTFNDILAAAMGADPNASRETTPQE